MIEKRNRLVLLSLLVAACSPAAGDKAVNEAEPAVAEALPAATPSLAGEWRVTALDGEPLTQIFTMNATVTGDRFMIRSDCLQLNWNFTQAGPGLSLTSPSAVDCPRGRTVNEVLAERVMGGVNMVLFSEDGSEVQLSGNRGTLTMTRR